MIEDVTREFNKGMWTIGYTGQSPERLKKHMANQHTFDRTTLRANGGPCDGDYYGLPWPCWGTAEMNHPGTPNLYDPSQAGRRRWPELPCPLRCEGAGRLGRRQSAGRRQLRCLSYPVGNELKGGHPEFTMADAHEARLGWRSHRRRACYIDKIAGEKTNWKTDLSGGIQRVAIKHGCAPFGNAKARAVVWTFPDPVPLHREPLYTNRRDLLPKYATYADKQAYRLPTKYASIQANDYSKDFPIILTSGPSCGI